MKRRSQISFKWCEEAIDKTKTIDGPTSINNLFPNKAWKKETFAEISFENLGI